MRIIIDKHWRAGAQEIRKSSVRSRRKGERCDNELNELAQGVTESPLGSSRGNIIRIKLRIVSTTASNG